MATPVKPTNHRRTHAERLSDRITKFCGSMPFVYFHILWFGGWLYYNLTAPVPFDPFPFGLLTLIVSLEAIVLATFILISQNRQAHTSARRARLDYSVNVKAEKETRQIISLLRKIDKRLK